MILKMFAQVRLHALVALQLLILLFTGIFVLLFGGFVELSCTSLSTHGTSLVQEKEPGDEAMELYYRILCFILLLLFHKQCHYYICDVYGKVLSSILLDGTKESLKEIRK